MVKTGSCVTSGGKESGAIDALLAVAFGHAIQEDPVDRSMKT